MHVFEKQRLEKEKKKRYRENYKKNFSMKIICEAKKQSPSLGGKWSAFVDVFNLFYFAYRLPLGKQGAAKASLSFLFNHQSGIRKIKKAFEQKNLDYLLYLIYCFYQVKSQKMNFRKAGNWFLSASHFEYLHSNRPGSDRADAFSWKDIFGFMKNGESSSLFLEKIDFVNRRKKFKSKTQNKHLQFKELFE